MANYLSTQLYHESVLQRRTNANQQQNPESDALVQIPVLHCDGHQQAADEQHVGVFQILNADLKQITRDLPYIISNHTMITCEPAVPLSQSSNLFYEQ